MADAQAADHTDSGHSLGGSAVWSRPWLGKGSSPDAATLDRIYYLAQFKQRPVTLQQLFELGKKSSKDALRQEALFLHKELPVRLSHRVVELERLPFGLADMPSVRIVRGMYVDSVREIAALPSPDKDDDEGHRFVVALDQIKRRHNSVVLLMAKGVLELKKSQGPDALKPEVYEFLDRFFMSRIGIRMLIGQHIALHEPPRAGYVGLICEKCTPAVVAREAITAAQGLCRLHYGVAPQVVVLGNVDLGFTYVPTHLRHMMIELLKNSMRAIIELNGPDHDPMPAIKIVLAKGNEDVTIKISDEGGGIARSGMPQIWTYLYTTAQLPSLDFDSPYAEDMQVPFAGLGFGLPISRLYARYFGGELQMISMEGYGTDAYLHLKRLADTVETLPRKLG